MERNYKVLIIDDEEGAIENLILCLKRYPFLTVEGTAKNGKSGIKLLDKVHPDLLFLDVELPDMEGITYQVVPAQNGQQCIVARGDTVPHKDSLMAAGFKWNPQRKIWWKYAA